MPCSKGIRRSWCPEARLAEHREAQAVSEEAERKQRSASSALFGARAPPPCARSEFPSLKARPCPTASGTRDIRGNASAYVSDVASTKCGRAGAAGDGDCSELATPPDKSTPGCCIELDAYAHCYLDTSFV